MIIKNKKYLLILLLDLLLLTLGLIKQDLKLNNYSYYATYLNGYFYLLLIAILSGLLMAYVSFNLSTKLNAYIAFFSFIISSIIPSTIDQSTIIANIHLIFAYIGFCLSIIFSINNLRYYRISKPKNYNYHLFIFLIIIFVSAYFYLDNMVINFMSEYIYTAGILINNSLMYLIDKKYD